MAHPILRGGATPYPLIDSDPHFARVVRYMRRSDYGVWAGATAGFPAALALLEFGDRTGKRHLGAVKVGLVLENEREQRKDLAELSQRAKEGKPIYGESFQPPHVQAAAARHSTFSQFKLAAVPWFNFVNHPHHGVSTDKYYEAAGVPVPAKAQPIEDAPVPAAQSAPASSPKSEKE
ncbi:C-terminal of NADH-ubiquinone oxidoreductase 21 kDa subunit-domain-containing protein [Flagelloscypha sp. PMI_526]|nr:C-terminal of NADH-ubiquinone oxidoreductase 21 kDa subunit-domain-containing protein [Flagelloscypha sp. PMI_526]